MTMKQAILILAVIFTPAPHPARAEAFVGKPKEISDPQLADDKKTLGWSESYDYDGSPNSVPRVLVLYRSGKVIRRLQEGQLLWGWTFLERGQKVAVQSGGLHGSMGMAIRVYEVETGKMLSEFLGDEADMPHAPSWARAAEDQINRRFRLRLPPCNRGTADRHLRSYDSEATVRS